MGEDEKEEEGGGKKQGWGIIEKNSNTPGNH